MDVSPQVAGEITAVGGLYRHSQYVVGVGIRAVHCRQGQVEGQQLGPGGAHLLVDVGDFDGAAVVSNRSANQVGHILVNVTDVKMSRNLLVCRSVLRTHLLESDPIDGFRCVAEYLHTQDAGHDVEINLVVIGHSRSAVGHHRQGAASERRVGMRTCANLAILLRGGENQVLIRGAVRFGGIDGVDSAFGVHRRGAFEESVEGTGAVDKLADGSITSTSVDLDFVAGFPVDPLLGVAQIGLLAVGVGGGELIHLAAKFQYFLSLARHSGNTKGTKKHYCKKTCSSHYFNL